MKYILLIYGDEKVWGAMSDKEMRRIYDDHRAYGEALTKAGVLAGGSELKPTSTASSVRFSNGQPRITDGPFAETKEQLGGFWVLRCADLDQALAWAEKCAEACMAPVEVRPFDDETND